MKKIAELTIGFGDGLIVASCLVTIAHVFSFTDYDTTRLILAGMGLGAVLLGIAAYFSSKYRLERLTAKTNDEVLHEQQVETEKTTELFQKIGLNENMQHDAASEIKKETEEWTAYLHKHAGEIDRKHLQNIPGTIFLVAFSFVCAMALVIGTWQIAKKETNGFILFCSVIILYGFVFGIIKSAVNNEAKFPSAFRMAFLCGACLVATYAVAQVFVK